MKCSTFPYLKYSICVFGGRTCAAQNAHGGQRTSCGSWPSLSTTLVSGIGNCLLLSVSREFMICMGPVILTPKYCFLLVSPVVTKLFDCSGSHTGGSCEK